MPAVARLSPRRPAPAAQPFQVFDLRERVAPPSAALIAAILEHGDVAEPLGAGRVRRSLSDSRLDQLEAMGALDVPAARAAQVAVVWDEAEGEVVRVIDDAPVRIRTEAQPAWWDLFDAEEPAPVRARRAWGTAR